MEEVTASPFGGEAHGDHHSHRDEGESDQAKRAKEEQPGTRESLRLVEALLLARSSLRSLHRSLSGWMS